MAEIFAPQRVSSNAVFGLQEGSIASITAAGGIASGEAFGVPSFARIVGGAAVSDAGGIPSGEAFGTPVATFVAGKDVFSGVVTRNKIGRSPLRA